MASCSANPNPSLSSSSKDRSSQPKCVEAVDDESSDKGYQSKEALEAGGPKGPNSSQPSLSAPQNTRKKTSRQRYFGLGKGSPAQQPQVYNADDYEHKYPDDRWGEELGPSSRFYRVYLDEHEKIRFELVEGWKENLDVLLVFAGLFSAVVTTIVVEASQNLLPDLTELNTRLLIHQSAILSQMLDLQRGVPFNETLSPPNVDTSFVASSDAKWVNGLWFTSLALSLATALIAVVAKQWLQSYMTAPIGTPRDRARLMHLRYMSLEKWKVSTIIGLLPFLLHVSLLLFFASLVIHHLTLNRAIGITVGSIALACYLAYFTTTMLPLFYPTCVYKTPLSQLAYSLFRRVALPIFSLIHSLLYGHSHYHRILRAIYAWVSNKISALETLRTLTAREVDLLQHPSDALNVDKAIFGWMCIFSFSPSATSNTLQAVRALGLLTPTIATEPVLKDMAEDVWRCLGEDPDTHVKSERLVRGLLPYLSSLEP